MQYNFQNFYDIHTELSLNEKANQDLKKIHAIKFML